MDQRSLPRRYRPQQFCEVLGQEPVVTTLKNALKTGRIGHAYLFAGTQGTGKTTIARLFAKALCCEALSDAGEPCTVCANCQAFQEGASLDFIEIDGASHRGIDDIRNINETVGYASALGKYKVYLIDEVHMLTKEAFNALLKTLEEPPPNVIFFFATTEPQKVLPTILSRCQRFFLQRISKEEIVAKLGGIAKKEGREVELGALEIIASQACGSMRDAESFLDQFFSFEKGLIRQEDVEGFLGIVTQKELFQFDIEGKKGNLAFVFSLTDKLFREGKDFQQFLSTLACHFRTVLSTHLGVLSSDSKETAENYAASAKFYRKDQLVSILSLVIRAQEEILKTPSPRVFLEMLLLEIMRSHQKIAVESLVERLEQLENSLTGTLNESLEETPWMPPETASEPRVVSSMQKVSHSRPPSVSPPVIAQVSTLVESTTEAPVPKTETAPSSPSPAISLEHKAKIDTALQFAAVELEGTLEKHR